MTEARTDKTETRPRALEGRYYQDPGIYAAELDRIFARTWQLVGHVSQLAEPGRIITAQLGDEGIIVANHKGELRAFYNVCQHRGHTLLPHDVTDVAPRVAKSIVCPYHVWIYDLGGRLTRARGEDVGEICIPSVRLDTMAGFLFANLDPDALSLAETLPGIEAELLALAPDAAARTLTARRTHVIGANWKLAVENYNECYHCPNVHKAFTSGVVSPASYRVTPRGNIIHHTAVGQGDKAAYSLGDGSDAAADYGSFFSWPVSSIQCYPGRVLNTFRWVPLAVDRTLLIREWWFDGDQGTDPTPEQNEIIDLDWKTTVAEDFDLMEEVQRGVVSRGYQPGPLIVHPSGSADVNSENAVPHLHELLMAALDPS
ncbi:MAG: aromatic ring-hydroxylating dioxygenase subunit alpha [Actinomycetota bacterium]